MCFIKVRFSLAFFRHSSVVIVVVHGIVNTLHDNHTSVISNLLVAFVNDRDSLPYWFHIAFLDSCPSM